MITKIQRQSNQKPYQFHYGNELIAFERTNRKSDSKQILIKVQSDCRVIAHAPSDASADDVIQSVKNRGRWIAKKLKTFRAQRCAIVPRQYISGESHYYMGRQYVLKVNINPDQNPQVKLLRGRINVSVKERDASKVKSLLILWYKTRAKEVFHRRLAVVIEKTPWANHPPPIRILTMQTQWGSCSPTGRLTINPHLVKAPRECIDYVILHELCHLVEHNHSDKFYRLMHQLMPEWESVKFNLDSIADTLLNN